MFRSHVGSWYLFYQVQQRVAALSPNQPDAILVQLLFAVLSAFSYPATLGQVGKCLRCYFFPLWNNPWSTYKSFPKPHFWTKLPQIKPRASKHPFLWISHGSLWTLTQFCIAGHNPAVARQQPSGLPYLPLSLIQIWGHFKKLQKKKLKDNSAW